MAIPSGRTPPRRGLLSLAFGAFAMALHLGPCTTDAAPRPLSLAASVLRTGARSSGQAR